MRKRERDGRRFALALLVTGLHLAVLALVAPADRGLPGTHWPEGALEVRLLARAGVGGAAAGSVPSAEPVPFEKAAVAAPAVAPPSAAPADEATPAPVGRPFHEAWELDDPATFAFPPAGLDELLEARSLPALLRVALFIDASGRLERLDVEMEAGLAEAERDAILDALRAARYEPGRRGGRLLASIKRIEMRHGGTVHLEVAKTVPPADLQE